MENHDIDSYVSEASKIIDQKIKIYSKLSSMINDIKTSLKEEEEMHKTFYQGK